jgi:3',5'-cyclic AMP phosphodiesterase CpdA
MHCSAALLLVCLTTTPDDRAAFHIEPYLQWPVRDAITVMWETTQATRGVLRYGTSPELDLRAVESDAQTVHEVRVTGLLPRTRYFYQACSDDLKSAVASFRTPPGPGEQWRLVVYGDSRSFPDRHQSVAELAAQFEPDLVLHTGDQVTRGTQRPMWKSQFFDPAAALLSRVPIITSLGNHEESAGNYFEYMSLPGNERYFSLDFADLHLVVLDSNSWGKSARESEQFAWLQADLAKPREARWTAVAFHHPLFSAHDKRAINPARWDWCPAFEDLGVDVVLTGHDHFYYRSWPIGRLGEKPSRGIAHITTAGGGAPLYRMKERSYTAVEQPVHHISVLDFENDVVRGKVIDVSGNIIDEYEITKKPTPAGEFCAYEVYELEHAIRREIESRPPVVIASHEKSVTVRDEIRVPHRFRVPVSARLTWGDLEASDTVGMHIQLKPDETMTIPVARQVSLDCLSATLPEGPALRMPRMQLQFLDERFRNRDIEFGPLKIWRDLTVRAASLPHPPTISELLGGAALGQLERFDLTRSDGTEAARVPAHVQMAASGNRLFFVFSVQHTQAGLIPQQETEIHSNPSDLVKGPHVRLLLADSTHSFGFAVSADGRRADNRDGDWTFDEPDWTAYVRRQPGAWTTAMILPRRLIDGIGELKCNAVHADPAQDIESCLSPTFDAGTDPDRVPDFRFGDRSVSRFARLVIE